MIPDFWQIIEGRQWRPEHILSEHLLSLWSEIDDSELVKVEVGIAFDKPLGKVPDRTKQGGETRYQNYLRAARERDERLDERMDEFEEFVRHYGEITSSIIDLEDSFSCSLEISGKGLKDLVINYPFVFEVSEKEEVKVADGNNVEEEEIEIELIQPDQNSPEIAIIDSGVMERHRYLSDAIVSANSKCYVEGETSKADHVKGGGHGTRVAGAILYPLGLPSRGTRYQLPCFVRNLRVLDKDNVLKHEFPAELMETVVNENQDCRVFNLSINSASPSRTKHMSTWASTIDTLIEENDILFIVSAGNITRSDINSYLRNGTGYPHFLSEPFCRIANPGQSSFALTVGSVNHSTYDDANWRSLGHEDEISAFSRIGSGIWGMIKPDVVEYGGGLVSSKHGGAIVSANPSTCTELIRSTLDGGNAVGRDAFGTSFSTPKVSHIVAQLLKLYPDDSANLLRALVIQGARLPNGYFENPNGHIIRQMGYGIPSLERVTKNTAQRITFYNTDEIAVDEGHLYSLKIPEFLRSPGEEHDILVEVTLAYTAQVRRTRQRTKSYLATWLDWTTSKVGETFVEFRDYVLKEIDDDATSYDQERRRGMNTWDWKIKSNLRGSVDGISRSNSTAQKDWMIIKSHELPEDFCFAVRAHKGWDESKEHVPYALVVSLEILNSELEVYEAIRIENEVEIEV
jgi:hypothetical protein